MTVVCRFDRVGRVLLKIQGALTLVYALVYIVIGNMNRDAISILLGLSGLLIHVLCLIGIRYCLNEYNSNVKLLQGVNIDFVTINGGVSVHAGNSCYKLSAAKKVYNKPIERAVYEIDNNVLYIPYNIDIHVLREV